jgi:hypothetical protein
VEFLQQGDIINAEGSGNPAHKNHIDEAKPQDDVAVKEA